MHMNSKSINQYELTTTLNHYLSEIRPGVRMWKVMEAKRMVEIFEGFLDEPTIEEAKKKRIRAALDEIKPLTP